MLSTLRRSGVRRDTVEAPRKRVPSTGQTAAVRLSRSDERLTAELESTFATSKLPELPMARGEQSELLVQLCLKSP